MSLEQLAAVFLLEKDKAFVEYYDAIYPEHFRHGDPTTAKWVARFERSESGAWSVVVTEKIGRLSQAHVVDNDISKSAPAEVFKFFRKLKNNL